MSANEQLLTVDVQATGDQVVVAIAGELDPHSSAELSDALAPLIADDGVKHLVIDLAGIRFIDSSGLRVVLSTRDTLDDRGATMALRSPSEAVQRILEITGLTDHLAIEGS